MSYTLNQNAFPYPLKLVNKARNSLRPPLYLQKREA